MTKLRMLSGGLFAMAMALALPAQTGSFDYYLLSLSWAPDFCAAPGGVKDPRECGTGRHVGFIVHGLWPQNNQGRGPENCGSSPVAHALVLQMLQYIPSESLIQHEWKTHGSCSGLSAQDYFAAVRKARDSVSIPAAFLSLTATTNEDAAAIENQFSSANPAFLRAAFRATCKGGELQEVRVCLDRNLNARACTGSAGECTTGSMKILPPR